MTTIVLCEMCFMQCVNQNHQREQVSGKVVRHGLRFVQNCGRKSRNFTINHLVYICETTMIIMTAAPSKTHLYIRMRRPT